MKVNELMIGDWVKHSITGQKGKVYRICGNEYIAFIDGDTQSELVEPIPLTPEILEKNGFNDTSFEANHKYKYVIHTNEYQLGYYPKTNSFNVYKKGIDPFYTKDVFCCGFQNIVKYVHELQHALKLCGIDKEIIV